MKLFLCFLFRVEYSHLNDGKYSKSDKKNNGFPSFSCDKKPFLKLQRGSWGGGRSQSP